MIFQVYASIISNIILIPSTNAKYHETPRTRKKTVLVIIFKCHQYRMTAGKIIDKTMLRKSWGEFTEPEPSKQISRSARWISAIDKTVRARRDFFRVDLDARGATCNVQPGVRRGGFRAWNRLKAAPRRVSNYSLTAYSLLAAHCQYARSEELPVAPIGDRSIGSDSGGSRTPALWKDALAQNRWWRWFSRVSGETSSYI